jgi:hypothetical protein
VTRDEWLDAIVAELNRAQAKFPSFHSGHEGYAVIREELDELWDAVKQDDIPHAIMEAQQVAAMALRFMIDLASNSTTGSRPR